MLRDDVWVDHSGSLFGPDVTLIRRLRDGDVVKERLPVAIAKALLLFNDVQNGTDFISGHIEFGGLLDVW